MMRPQRSAHNGPPAFWLDDEAAGETFAAFRARFSVERREDLRLAASASGPYTIWIDGEVAQEGPVRARTGVSALATTTVTVSAGDHVVAVLCHHEGVATRILEAMPAHLRVELARGSYTDAASADPPGPDESGRQKAGAPASVPVELSWRGTRLAAYTTGVRRINPELGWVDWCDTGALPRGWRRRDFDDRAWKPDAWVELDGWAVVDSGVGEVSFAGRTASCIGEGFLAERYGYERDDPPARFLLRELTGEAVRDDAHRLPSQGVWRRYDAGAIGLVRPEITVDVPEGTIVEVAYCEELHEGRVNPFVTLSLGPTCNMDHFVARGGPQTLEVSGYRGGRFVEVHLVYPSPRVLPAAPRQAFGEPDDRSRPRGLALRVRTAYPHTVGSIATGDALLDRIWEAGARTLAACTEDAVDDCPTRERGEWLGDVVTVGAAIAGAAFSDLRVFRKALIDAALNAREDGMVAGLCPGTVEHIPSYAATWVEGVVDYVELTGDRSVLALLYGSMTRNVDALAAYLGPEGLTDGDGSAYPLGWVFVDWGYVPNEGPADMVLTMHLLNAVRSGLRWYAMLTGRPAASSGDPWPPADGALADLLPDSSPSEADRRRFEDYEARVTAVLRRYLDACLSPQLDWTRLGYHRAVLAMRHGLIGAEHEEEVLDAIAHHQDRCFPNDPSAPRNDAPFKSEPRLITPYFYHYAMPLFAEADRMEYVLEQYRSCWGWLLADDHTTLCEVFDRRWSQCHQWSGSPTWQLSRYVLGLQPAFSRGRGHYRFSGRRHALRAEGTLPLPAAGGALVAANGSTDATGGPDAHARGQAPPVIGVRSQCEQTLMLLEITTPEELTIHGRDDATAVLLEPGHHAVAGDTVTGAVSIMEDT